MTTVTAPEWIVAVDPAHEGSETTIFHCMVCGWYGGEDDVEEHKCSEQNMMEKL